VERQVRALEQLVGGVVAPRAGRRADPDRHPEQAVLRGDRERMISDALAQPFPDRRASRSADLS